MNHRSNKSKLKRSASHRKALLANQAAGLFEHGRIRTTLGKAKALRPVTEKLITLAKRGEKNVHAIRQAKSFLPTSDAVQNLFQKVGPACADRQSGYCRITKLGPRMSDSAPMAIIEIIDYAATFDTEDLLDDED